MKKLYNAIKCGDMVKFDKYIKTVTSPSQVLFFNGCAIAARRGNLQMLDKMIRCGYFDPSANQNEAITLAWIHDRDKVVERLLLDKRVADGPFIPDVAKIIRNKIEENTKISVILKGVNFYNKTRLSDVLTDLIMDFVCIKYKKCLRIKLGY
jgi:hypothetical protein